MREMKDSGVQWIGVIPASWSVEKTIRIFSVIGSGTTPKGESYYTEAGTNWLQSGDITGGVISTPNKHISYQALKDFSALSVYEAPFLVLAMYGASVGNLSFSMIDAAVNQACCVLSIPKTNLWYAFYSVWAAKDYLIWLSVGGGQPNISQAIIKRLWLPMPALDEQSRIAAYLDRRCATIDALIANQQQQIEKLKQYKQAVITEAVTRGLDPNVKMKDSGVEWIGAVPEHWNICRKISFHCTEGISYGIVKLFDPDDAHGVKVLRCSDVLAGFIDTSHIRTVTQEVSNEYRRTILHGGEVVINVRGSLGGCAVVSSDMAGYNIAREVAVVRLNNTFVNRYVMYFFLSKAFVTYQHAHLSGSVYVGLNIELLSSVSLPLPTIAEQKLIVSHLDTKCAQIDSLIALKQQKADKLAQYKKSLIYEVVTGKREIE